jgi:hypothetical protein
MAAYIPMPATTIINFTWHRPGRLQAVARSIVPSSKNYRQSRPTDTRGMIRVCGGKKGVCFSELDLCRELAFRIWFKIKYSSCRLPIRVRKKTEIFILAEYFG